MSGTAASSDRRRRDRAVAIGVGSSSAAVLIFEIVLTRVFAITQFHHFAFVTVSLALLGFGASGSLLTAFPALGRGGPPRLALIAGLQSVSTVAAYAIVNRFPFDSFAIAFDTTQFWLLGLNYLVVSVPFLCGGAVIGISLAGWDQSHPIPSNRTYAHSLVGAGAGCVAALGALEVLGGVGVVLLSAICAMGAAIAFAAAVDPVSARLTMGLAGLTAMLAVGLVAPPDALDLELSEYKELSAALRFPGAEVVSTRWNTASRVDHVVSEGIRSLPGLSFTYDGDIPPQEGLTFDGDDLSPIVLVSPEESDFAEHMLGSLPFQLEAGGEAAVLGPRGGLDVVVGLATGAGSVTAVEPNELAIVAVGETTHDVYADPRVETIVEEPRVYMERTDRRFDVIELALTAPYRPVTSGAYSLSEDHRLTEEAFASYVDRLRPDGVLAVMRWLQLPPSEETRVLALVAEAMRDAGADPSQSVVALRTYAAMLVMAKPAGFSVADVELIRAFAEERRFDLVALPGLDPADTNRFNQLPEDEYHRLATALLEAPDPSDVFAEHSFDIAPPTDDRPYFSHFFKWSQTSEVVDSIGRTWQPFGGAGYFVVLAVLAIASVAALVLIVGPLVIVAARRTSAERSVERRGWTVAYFGLLGIAFLFVEIPIIQHYILLLGEPARALGVVLFALLLASGLGSLSARPRLWLRSSLAVVVAAGIAPFVIPAVTAWLLPAGLAGRMIGGALALLPLGFVMGTMFPNGLAHLEQTSPSLVAWAWGINGLTSVMSAVGATLLMLSFGASAVMVLGALAYGLCLLLARRAARRPVAVTPPTG